MFWAGWAAALFAGGLLLSANSLSISNDEAWFLQVARRAARGERLYRDVFYGATPLAVMLAIPAVRLFGPRLLVVKVINTLCFTAIGLLVLWLGDFLGLPGWFPPLAALFLLAFCSPWTMGTAVPYTPLASALLLAAFCLVLGYAKSPASPMPLILAAAAVGLSFSAKQTIGIYGAAALAGSALLLGVDFAALLAAALAFAAAVGLATLLPVLRWGAWNEFLDYAFFNKRTYTARAGIGYTYLDGLRVLAHALLPARKSRFREAIPRLLYLFPPLALALLVARLALPGAEGRVFWAVAALFLAALTGDVFPRVSVHHLSCAVPAMLPFLSLPLASGGWGTALAAATLALCAALLADQAARARSALRRGEVFRARRGWLAGTLIPLEYETVGEDFAARARRFCGEQPIFLLAPNAAWVYQSASLKNPTPYDYPLVTAFGLTGERVVVERLRSGALRWVLLGLPAGSPLNPPLLEQFVREEMHPVAEMPFGVLYAAAPSAPPDIQ